jgi:predicted DNA-binding transcriptional regulator AlpA
VIRRASTQNDATTVVQIYVMKSRITTKVMMTMTTPRSLTTTMYDSVGDPDKEITPVSNKSANPSQQDGTSLLIDTKTVAALCGVSVRTIQRWVTRATMPNPILVNGRPRWRRAQIVQWVENGCPRRTRRPRN